MNAAETHLLFNHLPLFASFIGAIILISGMFFKSSHTRSTAYFIFVLSVTGAIISMNSGEGAEEIIEHWDGISHDQIHEHEEAAESAIIVHYVLGAVSLIGLWFEYKKHKLTTIISSVALIISLFGFTSMAKVSNDGGKIRHDREIKASEGNKETHEVESESDND